MKFGVRLAVQGEMGAAGQGWDYARQMAIEAEETGFDSVWLPDHVINAHMNKHVPMLENWTVLSALGALTKRVMLAGHTHNNALRHPAVMAKMAATFDTMFDGRLIFALAPPGSVMRTSATACPGTSTTTGSRGCERRC